MTGEERVENGMGNDVGIQGWRERIWREEGKRR